jgi:hypothetical protein
LADTYIIQPSHWPAHIPANQTRSRSGKYNTQRAAPYRDLRRLGPVVPLAQPLRLRHRRRGVGRGHSSRVSHCLHGCHQLVFILAVINCCSCWLSSTAVHTGCHQLVFMLDVINCCSYWLSSIWCFDCKIALRKVLRPTEACAASWPAFSPCRSASLWYRDASCNATVCCCRAAGSSLHSRVSEGLHGPWPQGLGFRV